MHGEELDWSLVDLAGSVSKKPLEDVTAKSSNGSFAPGKLRWNPASSTLYKVGSSLNSGATVLPPQVGWMPVDGLEPAPAITFCQEESTRPEKIMAATMPGKLLRRIAESAPSVEKVQASIQKHSPWRSQSLPRMLRWGTMETAKARRRADFQLGDTATSKMSSKHAEKPGETALLVFSVILSRPSFHFEWGAEFDKQQLVSTGAVNAKGEMGKLIAQWTFEKPMVLPAFGVSNVGCEGRRIILGIEPHSPLDRWNTWQTAAWQS
ncbi:unnamed protein product [Effrenium voratum]|uniref:Uncharacterized protein n=1 Tax=Effrenium voratum TaxID=2562239 RepID=A0AA36IXX2_9DINO|nr:unnamed protein product [Effrenium voratum]